MECKLLSLLGIININRGEHRHILPEPSNGGVIVIAA